MRVGHLLSLLDLQLILRMFIYQVYQRMIAYSLRNLKLREHKMESAFRYQSFRGDLARHDGFCMRRGWRPGFW